MAFTSLNALHAFVSVARHLSYAKAARELGVSPSALSQSVKQLEERLGVTLLMRTSRNVALTEAGHHLLDNAGPAVDQALESLRTVKTARGAVTGRVHLNVPSIAVPLVLAGLLPHFHERFPEVEVEVQVNDRLVNTVAGQFDAGIRLVEAIDRDMVHLRLTQPSRLIVTAAPAYLQQHGIPTEPQDLQKHRCLGVRRSLQEDTWVWELERGTKTYRVPVRGPVTTNDAELMRALAIAGVGLFYSLEERVLKDLESGHLVAVLEAYAPKVPGLFLYYPSRSQISPALEALVATARTWAKSNR